MRLRLQKRPALNSKRTFSREVTALQELMKTSDQSILQRPMNVVALATLVSVFFTVTLHNPSANAGTGDSDDGDDLEDVNPVFDDDYFENNPEEGNSRWGWQIDACDDETGCVVNNADNPAGPGTPPKPPGSPGGTCEPVAPTAATPNAAEAVAALNSTLGVNPEARGLTGLETWLWVADPPGEVSWTQAGVPGIDETCSELPAPTTTFTATVDSWTFHIDGEHDSATYTSDTPGTEDDPAATHVFDYVGTYQLELTADLRGAVATRVPVDRRDYEVIEVRSRLTE